MRNQEPSHESTVWETSGGARTAPPDPTKLRASSLGLRLLGFPDTDVACLRHDEQTDDETHRRHHDGVDQGIPDATARQKGGGGDERHEAPAPAVADVVGHGNGRVADPAREVLS